MHVILRTVKAPVEHVRHVSPVLSLLSDTSVSLELNMRSFLTDTMDYFRNVIRPVKLEIAAHTSGAIRPLKEPSSVTERW